MSRKTLPRRTRRFAAVLSAALAFSLLPVAGTVVHAEPAATVVGLQAGDRGPAVRSVQQALIDHDVNVVGGVDGIFGPGTNAAVQAFQTREGLEVTGTVTDATASALGLSGDTSAATSASVATADVKLVQETLLRFGYTVVGGADGVYGPNTARPLAAFQGSNGLQASGEIDAVTMSLVRALDGGTTDKSNNDAATAEPDANPAEPELASAGPTAAAPSAELATQTQVVSAIIGVRMGSRGTAVEQVQQILVDLGYRLVGGADGVFGVLTATTVQEFQAANGLVVDGLVGPNTAAALAKAKLNGGGQPGPAGVANGSSSPLVGVAYGSAGPNVRVVQQALVDAGISLYGGVDGVFGPATQTSLKEFQKVNELELTGKVDRATADALAKTGSATAASTSTSNDSIIGLKAGTAGTLVQQLQQALLDAGIAVRGGADGIFGPATAAALKEFQKQQGLEATGVVNKDTYESLSQPKAPLDQATAEGFAEFGERSSRVETVQQALVDAGIALYGGVDGVFGQATANAILEFQRAKGLSVTGTVNATTAKALGVAASVKPSAVAPVVNTTIKAFPVQGWCGYVDTWHAPRSGGRLHIGTDVIADEGKHIYATDDGVIEIVYHDKPGSLTGNGVRLRRPDNTYIFYAHLSGIADGIKVGSKVKAGQILGAVGATGNTSTPHLHIEIHPNGGAAVNPYPILKAVDGCKTT